MSYLKGVIAEDWADCNFEIGLNLSDFVEVRFDRDKVDSKEGLVAYMNVLTKSEGKELDRMPDCWGADIADKIVFLLKPPWLKFRSDRASSNPMLLSVLTSPRTKDGPALVPAAASQRAYMSA